MTTNLTQLRAIERGRRTEMKIGMIGLGRNRLLAALRYEFGGHEEVHP